MASATKKTKNLFTIAITTLALAVILLLVVLPTNQRLISTASTHTNIDYLTSDTSLLNENRRLHFAIYDADCDMVQLCFSLRPNDRAFWQGKKIAITINGTKVEKWEHFTFSTWKKDYFNFLLHDVPPGSLISFTYNGQTINIK